MPILEENAPTVQVQRIRIASTFTFSFQSQKSLSSGSCTIATGMRIEIMHAKAGDIVDPQEMIVGARRLYGNAYTYRALVRASTTLLSFHTCQICSAPAVHARVVKVRN